MAALLKWRRGRPDNGATRQRGDVMKVKCWKRQAGRARAVYGVIIFRSWSDQGGEPGQRKRKSPEQLA